MQLAHTASPCWWEFFEEIRMFQVGLILASSCRLRWFVVFDVSFKWSVWCHPRIRYWGLTMAALPKHHLFFDLCGFALFALVLLCRAFLYIEFQYHVMNVWIGNSLGCSAEPNPTQKMQTYAVLSVVRFLWFIEGQSLQSACVSFLAPLMTLSPKSVASVFSVSCHHKIQCSMQRAFVSSDSRNVAVESYEAMAKLRLLVCLFVCVPFVKKMSSVSGMVVIRQTGKSVVSWHCSFGRQVQWLSCYSHWFENALVYLFEPVGEHFDLGDFQLCLFRSEQIVNCWCFGSSDCMSSSWQHYICCSDASICHAKVSSKGVCMFVVAMGCARVSMCFWSHLGFARERGLFLGFPDRTHSFG